MTVLIDVQNTGKVTGDQVVQLYSHQRSGSSWPVRELKGFRRITLKPGERKMVELKLDTNELGFWSPQTHKWSIEPGRSTYGWARTPPQTNIRYSKFCRSREILQ
jgi:beta-glucosidase